ncbi:hypothetical protein ABH897_001606 [Paenibacillus sp. RC73]|uniref:hypothetical protein n=1 Tax=Paenibacillus TaxID=44249 RepID=UPI00126A068C|nr:hypothetical protein [Paenibacillus terrae]
MATGFGGNKEPYKLPDKPKEAAVSTFSEYMNASMSRDYDKMLSLSDDYRFVDNEVCGYGVTSYQAYSCF